MNGQPSGRASADATPGGRGPRKAPGPSVTRRSAINRSDLDMTALPFPRGLRGWAAVRTGFRVRDPNRPVRQQLSWSPDRLPLPALMPGSAAREEPCGVRANSPTRWLKKFSLVRAKQLPRVDRLPRALPVAPPCAGKVQWVDDDPKDIIGSWGGQGFVRKGAVRTDNPISGWFCVAMQWIEVGGATS